MTTSTFEERLKNNSWLTYVQQEVFHRDPQLHVFPQILKEKNQDDLFSKSKKSLLRNTKSNLYILDGSHVWHLLGA